MLPFSSVWAQLIVNGGQTPQQLVQNVLLGAGVSVSNVNYSGGNLTIGSFSNGNSTNLGLSSGVVLCTGKLANIPQPVSAFSGEIVGTSGDADLDAITSNSTYDGAVLQFDFIPISDTIRFRYIFGSEEYPEYVCSNYNDVFAFFVSGPNPAGGNYIKKNIALIPGTNLPVAINTVNNGNVGTNGSSGGCTSLAYSYLHVDNEAISGTTIVYDGFSVVLTAWCKVVPCQQYHIKIAVADVGDSGYDSGVFLEAGSFSSTSFSVTSQTTNPTVGNDSTIYEGCSAARIKFKRSGSSLSSPLTINYNISGSAVNGVDFNSLPGSITFQANYDTVSTLLIPINDGINETTEIVKISIPVTVVCASIPDPFINIYINDAPPLSVSMIGDTTIICPSSFTVTPNIIGGVAPYIYSWNNGSTSPTIQVNPNSTTTYALIVMDGCGTAASSDFTVNMPTFNALQALAFGDTTICAGATVPISAYATGGIGSHTFLWSNNMGTNDFVSVSPNSTTTYTVSVTDSCGAVATANVTVTVIPVSAEFSFSYITNRDILFTDQSTNGYSFSWNFGDGSSSDIQNPTHLYADTGVFIVTLNVINDVGCISEISHQIIIYPDFHIYIPNAFTPDGDLLNEFFIPVAIGVTKSEMDIFDRWGNIIFSSYDIQPSWNGKTKNGIKAPLGVYVYLLSFETPIGKKYSFNGTVTLVK